MSKASTASKLRQVNDLLHTWGYNISEEPGCWSRDNGAKDWTSGEPEGMLNHHFVIPLTSPVENGIKNVTFGDSTLVGPKCNWYTHEHGIRFIAYGPANHAGRGNNAVLQRVVAGLPYSGKTGPDDYNGNSFYLGQEAHHPGDSTPWPASLVENILALNAAICIVFNWNENHCINHKYHTTRKIDMSSSWPGGLQPMIAEFTEKMKVKPDIPVPTKEDDEMSDLIFFNYPNNDGVGNRVFLSNGVSFRHIKNMEELANLLWIQSLLKNKVRYITDGDVGTKEVPIGNWDSVAYTVASAPPVADPYRFGEDIADPTRKGVAV